MAAAFSAAALTRTARPPRGLNYSRSFVFEVLGVSRFGSMLSTAFSLPQAGHIDVVVVVASMAVINCSDLVILPACVVFVYRLLR